MIIAKNKNFVIRTFRKSDAKSLTEHINNKKIIKNLSNNISYPYKIKKAEEWIKLSQKKYRKKNPEFFSFGIEIDKKIVGGIGFHKINPEHHNAEMGYWLGEEYWGKGIMTKVTKEVVKYGFKKFKFKRIYAGVFSFNKPSMRVLEKAGFKFEGILKKDYYHKGMKKYLDTYVYAKLK